MNNQEGQPEYDSPNQSQWTKELELINRLQIENGLLKDKYNYLISNLNSKDEKDEIIKDLAKTHYRIMKDNNRMLLRILEEIDSINQILTARSKKDE